MALQPLITIKDVVFMHNRVNRRVIFETQPPLPLSFIPQLDTPY